MTHRLRKRGFGTGSGLEFGPGGRWAMLTPVGSDISRQVSSVATDVLAENEFQIAESPAATPEDLLRVCHDVAGRVDVHVVLARLSAGYGGDSSEALSQIVEYPLPGVTELVRSIQYTSGYSRAIFERCTAGWVDSTLALVLPADVGAVYDSLSELLPVVVEVLDGSGQGGDFTLTEFAEDPIPLSPRERPAPKPDGATILQMPRQGKSGQGKSGQGSSGKGPSGEESSGKGASGKSSSGKGSSGKSSSGKGTSGKGSSGKGTSGTGKPTRDDDV